MRLTGSLLAALLCSYAASVQAWNLPPFDETVLRIRTAVTDYINTALNDDPDNKVYGQSQDVKYEFLITSNECNTNNLPSMLRGAVGQYLRKPEKRFDEENTQCLVFDQGGPCHGYMKIGRVADFDSEVYCGPVLEFETVI